METSSRFPQLPGEDAVRAQDGAAGPDGVAPASSATEAAAAPVAASREAIRTIQATVPPFSKKARTA